MKIHRYAPIAAVGLCLLVLPSHAGAEDARVTIVTILASTTHNEIDPKLQQIAAEVRKHESGLTGFKLHNSQFKSVNVGQKEKFDLVDDQSADVTVLEKNESKKRVTLSVKPPTVGEIKYSIVYDKFFPIVTRHLTPNERLIIAVMVQPPKEKEKDGK